jgi:flagellin FlaB
MRRDRRADIGIGTMIVFIAMVLVAAVAAAVLISTANQVREQATSTGDQAINNVAAGFIKQGVNGFVNATNGLVDSLNVTLRLSAGSPDINMNNVVVKVIVGTTARILTFEDVDAASRLATYYATMPLDVGPAWTSNQVVTQGDLLNIEIGGAATGFADWILALGPLTHVQIVITPAFGQPTMIEVNTPETLLGGTVVIL